MLYATTPDMFRGADADAFGRLAAAVRHTLYGADCYASALLAGGWSDLVAEASLQPYDFCALVPVVEGAGGVMTDWQGRPLTLESDGRVVACGDPRLLAPALARLAG
jgi:inositol-phosphate phosphatase/L-galactose 1-phosphate phosphatase/histidinol-phosphatase